MWVNYRKLCEIVSGDNEGCTLFYTAYTYICCLCILFLTITSMLLHVAALRLKIWLTQVTSNHLSATSNRTNYNHCQFSFNPCVLQPPTNIIIDCSFSSCLMQQLKTSAWALFCHSVSKVDALKIYNVLCCFETVHGQVL